MDDDSDRSSEATQLEENSAPEDTMHPHDDAEDSENYYDQRDATPLQISPMPTHQNSTTSRALTLVVSDLSEVPVKYEMQRHELDRLKSMFLQFVIEIVKLTEIKKYYCHLEPASRESPRSPSNCIAQAAQISSLQCSNSQSQGQNLNTIEIPKPSSSSHNVKLPNDGYNWRKYGQKQVKSPQGSRSYYKCTYTECDAKKIESCDQNNSVTKVVYKSQHKHDPPMKAVSNGGIKNLSSPKSLKRKSISTPGLKKQLNERVKKNSAMSHDSVMKHPKKPKFTVHASDDVEISADGYRWRKYGQKKVKGNPHPRNYYKCTCAGCGVTKHIEKAVDGSSNIVITYKGVHDHDKPVPKKRRGHAGVNVLMNQVSATESVKTNESARTLLSVGFEIKRC